MNVVEKIFTFSSQQPLPVVTQSFNPSSEVQHCINALHAKVPCVVESIEEIMNPCVSRVVSDVSPTIPWNESSLQLLIKRTLRQRCFLMENLLCKVYAKSTTKLLLSGDSDDQDSED